MSARKSQVSPFIILGLVVLIVAGAFLYLESGQFSQTQGDSLLAFGKDVQQYAEQCLKGTAEGAVAYVGKRGGYYVLPPLANESLQLPYYLYEQKEYAISEEELVRQLKMYLDSELFFCFRNFAAFRKTGIDVLFNGTQTSVSLDNDSLQVELVSPLVIQKEEAMKTLTLPPVSVPTSLQKLHAVAQSFMDEQMQHPVSLCISCLADLGERNGVRIELLPIDVENMVFSIIDKMTVAETSRINNQRNTQLRLEFLNQYDFPRVDEENDEGEHGAE